MQGRAGEYIHHQVVHLTFKEVSTSFCMDIHLKVADVEGQRVQFLHGSGEFTAVLSFKRVA